jgi:hypothetical protein
VTKSAVAWWNAGRFIGVLAKGRRTGRMVDEIILPRRRANESQPLRCDIFPSGRVVSVLWEVGDPAGSKWSSVRPKAR